MKKFKGPEVVEKTREEIDAIIATVRQSNLPQATQDFLVKCIELACWLPLILQKKAISLSRLKTMIFGEGHQDRKQKKKKSDDGSSGGDTSGTDPSNTQAQEKGELPSTPDKSCNRKGRHSHESYVADEERNFTVAHLQVGSLCPESCGGKMYALPNGVVIRILGQSIANVIKCSVERLRCNLCGHYVSATLPSELGDEKYAPSFKAHLALMKFELAVPYYRLEGYQRALGCPLPDATQWKIIEKLGGYCYIIFATLKRLLANGKLVYNDDTKLKLLSMPIMTEENTKARKGAYTTCVIGSHDGHGIILYLNGALHSGENIKKLLAKRAKEKPPILQMSDALACNTSSGIETLSCYCLGHGFRKFKELKAFFPEACHSIMHELAKVFALDGKTQCMSDEDRLKYHQQYSAPIMHVLHDKIESLLADKRTEGNGDLAAALKYMRKHWVKLTAFLQIAGAPLTTNIVERALKLAIRSRKNSLFYKSAYSAELSGMLTSIIATCKDNGVNPVEYLTVLQTHHAQIKVSPCDWMPWAYQETLRRGNTSTAPLECIKLAPVTGASSAAAGYSL